MNVDDWIEEEKGKKSKNFLKCFRKNIDECVVVEEERITSK
jgi:hypothetical protein